MWTEKNSLKNQKIQLKIIRKGREKLYFSKLKKKENKKLKMFFILL